jgi:hypothetical protein
MATPWAITRSKDCEGSDRTPLIGGPPDLDPPDWVHWCESLAMIHGRGHGVHDPRLSWEAAPRRVPIGEPVADLAEERAVSAARAGAHRRREAVTGWFAPI